MWEATLHQTILQEWKHHWDNISYVVKHKYEPDFVKIIDGKTILLEAKGRFWDYAELVFLFQKPLSPMPQAKKRKDGTKRTHAEWAETNNFIWYSEETLPKEWRT